MQDNDHKHCIISQDTLEAYNGKVRGPGLGSSTAPYVGTSNSLQVMHLHEVPQARNQFFKGNIFSRRGTGYYYWREKREKKHEQ